MKKIEPENSKEKILSVATKLFAQKGFDGVSIREICKEASINICMISYYFGGKKELYLGILDNLIERQVEYASTFIDLNKNPLDLSYQERVDLLFCCLDKFVDFFYSKVSGDLVTILLKEQQNADFALKSPVVIYLRKLIASILGKDENDREVIFKTLFITSQVNSAKIIPAFSLRLLGQDEFIQEDIIIIKENVKFYLKALLKEVKIG